MRELSLGRLAISLPVPLHGALESVALAQRAEQDWGYASAWLAEINGFESFGIAGAVAVATERMGIGTAIVPTSSRSAALLAMSAATIADLSDGRFQLGIGSSTAQVLEGWHGRSADAPLARVRETLQVVRECLAGGVTDFDGRSVRSNGFQLAVPPTSPPPILVAALGPRMLDLAGEIGDGVVLNLFSRGSLPRLVEGFRAGLDRAGRDAADKSVVARLFVRVTDDVESARQLARESFVSYFHAEAYRHFFATCGFERESRIAAEALARGDQRACRAAVSDRFIDEVAILGTREACVDRLREVIAAGVTDPIIAPLCSDRAEAIETLEALAPAHWG